MRSTGPRTRRPSACVRRRVSADVRAPLDCSSGPVRLRSGSRRAVVGDRADTESSRCRSSSSAAPGRRSRTGSSGTPASRHSPRRSSAAGRGRRNRLFGAHPLTTPPPSHVADKDGLARSLRRRRATVRPRPSWPAHTPAVLARGTGRLDPFHPPNRPRPGAPGVGAHAAAGLVRLFRTRVVLLALRYEPMSRYGESSTAPPNDLRGWYVGTVCPMPVAAQCPGAAAVAVVATVR